MDKWYYGTPLDPAFWFASLIFAVLMVGCVQQFR